MARGRQPDLGRPRLVATVCALAVLAPLLTGCTTAAGLQAAPGAGTDRSASAVPHSSADYAFENLMGDLFFVTLPPGSTRTGQKCPKPTGPHGSCTLAFTSTLPPTDVYADFAKRAAATGWGGEGKDSEGRTVSWAKDLYKGTSAHILLSPLDPGSTSPPYRYELTGSV